MAEEREEEGADARKEQRRRRLLFQPSSLVCPIESNDVCPFEEGLVDTGDDIEVGARGSDECV